MNVDHAILCRAVAPTVFAVVTLTVATVPALGQEPLCGIRSVFTAAILLGDEPLFTDVLQPEFVGSERGSSIAELERAARKLGLHAMPVTGLTTQDLRCSKSPIVLHVMTALSSANYDHFVLFAGYDGEKAAIYDGTNGLRFWTLAEIASRWDGNALVLSKQPIQITDLTAPSRKQRIYWLGAIGAAVALALHIQRSSGRPPSRFVAFRNQAGALLIVAGCGAWVFHRTSPNGFIVGPEAVRGVRAANASRFLPSIDIEAARSLHRSGEAIFVDARSADDFMAGHIPGAVNFSAHTPDAQAFRIARGIFPGRRLVVYCVNPKCPYAVKVAQWLLEAQHDDVVIFADGWQAWRATPQSAMRTSGEAPQ